MYVIYGIKNCDTMKKAFTWLDAHGVTYRFHDYKKEPVPVDVLKQAIDALGWDVVINRKGTTWRGLPEAVKDGMNAQNAVQLGVDMPSVIKRPLLVHGARMVLGFDSDNYARFIAG